MRQGRFAGLGGGEARSVRTRLRVVLLPPLVAVAVAGGARSLAFPVVGIAPGDLAYWLLPVIALVGGFVAAAYRLSRIDASDDGGEAARYRGFVEMMEAGNQSWFWETNADGKLSYMTDAFTAALDQRTADFVGRRFADLELVGQAAGENGRPADATLSFHLKARFPFRDLMVAPDRSKDMKWLLSGTPRFDAVGRFLGFRGYGVSLTQQRSEVAAADRRARFDNLTGLPNRGQMDYLLDEAITNADARKQSCGLFLIDLDRFKAVNDTLGHPVGDVLLQMASKRMTEVVAGDGQVGRLGGDEFQAIFPGIGEEGHLAAIAEKLIRVVSAPYQIQGNTVTIGASVGIAISRPASQQGGGTHRAALVKQADLAVYAAKNAGRGTFRFFESEMHTEENDRQMLQADLKDALAKDQIKLLYQPVVSVEDGILVGFEALVRWWHPTRGPIGPSEFLPIAEAARLMPTIGEWVLRTSFAEAARWPETLRLIVNLNPPQINAALPSSLVSALANSGIDPRRLEFDLHHESVASTDPVVGEIITALKGIGIRLCLDDFGSKGADVAMLRDGAIDRVKLDSQFYRQANNDRGYRLVAGVVRMARDSGLLVTAEGAETADDLRVARDIGCTDVQGHLFGRPMPAEEARALAAEARPVDQSGPMLEREPRHRLIRTGALASPSGEAWSVRLRNVSVGGAMVESNRALPHGTPVELDLGDGVRVTANVRWSDEGRLGLKFVESFDIARLSPRRREAAAEVRMLRPDYLRAAAQQEAEVEAEIQRLRIQHLRQKAVEHGRKT